jgi:hypothetical protein
LKVFFLDNCEGGQHIKNKVCLRKGSTVMIEKRVEEEIKEQALRFGALAAGIASVEDVNQYAPKGHRPDDLLRGARSIVVIGCGLTSTGAWRAGSARSQATIGFHRPQPIGIALQIVGLIEKQYGHYAMLCPPGTVAGRYPYASLKLLAEMAGLGTRSMAAGTILHETYGLLYFGAAITTMPLAGDGMLKKSPCPHSSCVKIWEKRRTVPCLEACPTCLAGELEGGSIKWMEYNQNYCLPRAQTTAMGSFQKMLLDVVNQADAEKRKMMIYGSHFSRAISSLANSTEVSGQCFECVRRCPIGRSFRTRLK